MTASGAEGAGRLALLVATWVLRLLAAAMAVLAGMSLVRAVPRNAATQHQASELAATACGAGAPGPCLPPLPFGLSPIFAMSAMLALVAALAAIVVSALTARSARRIAEEEARMGLHRLLG